MNVAAPQDPVLLWAYRAYVLLFFLYLAAPLAAASAFAFNDSLFPSLPWQGFTLTGSSTAPNRSSACSMTGGSCGASEIRSISA